MALVRHIKRIDGLATAALSFQCFVLLCPLTDNVWRGRLCDLCMPWQHCFHWSSFAFPFLLAVGYLSAIGRRTWPAQNALQSAQCMRREPHSWDVLSLSLRGQLRADVLGLYHCPEEVPRELLRWHLSVFQGAELAFGQNPCYASCRENGGHRVVLRPDCDFAYGHSLHHKRGPYSQGAAQRHGSHGMRLCLNPPMDLYFSASRASASFYIETYSTLLWAWAAL